MFKSKIKIKFKYVQYQHQPTKYEIQVGIQVNIETQIQFPSCMKIRKLNLTKSTLPENIQSLIKSTLQKINSSINPRKYSKYFNQVSNPQNKFEKEMNQVQ